MAVGEVQTTTTLLGKVSRFDAESELYDNMLWGEMRTFTPTNKGYFFGKEINKKPDPPKKEDPKKEAKKKAQAQKKKK